MAEDQKTDRRQRLAEKLRENLKRRKDLSRARNDQHDVPPEAEAAAHKSAKTARKED